MEVQIRSVDLQMTDELRDYTQHRIEKLDRLVARDATAHIELRCRPQRTGADVTAVQVTIRAGRLLLRSEETDYEAKKAVDQAIDKMTRQMRKFHERRSDRKQHRVDTDALAAGTLVADSLNATSSIDDSIEEESDEFPVVRTKRFTMKPMGADEAIEQMDLLGHSFFLFRNVDEDELNVVYVRHDGTYGLIAPDVR